MAKVTIIRTDGSEVVREVAGDILGYCRREVHDGAFDFVNLRDGRVMAVIDQGYKTEFVDHGGGHFENKPVEALFPDNEKATEIYHSVCVPGTTHRIVGDVAIFLDAEVE